MGGLRWNIPVADQEAFDAAFWLAQPPAVQALPNYGSGSQPRVLLAQQLAGDGYSIDVPAMVFGDPYTCMLQRYVDGVGTFPLVPSGTGKTPDMSLPIAQIVALYPPFTPPAPPTPPSTNPVGGDLGFQFNGHEAFSCPATDMNPVGFAYVNGAFMYIKTQLNAGATMAGMASQPYCIYVQYPVPV